MRTARRWFLRLLALAALVGVGYGVYTIVEEGTADRAGDRGPVQGALERLADAQEKLGARMESLKPGDGAAPVRNALSATQRAHEAAVQAFRRRREEPEPIPDEDRIDEALGREFDYLDALRSALVNERSPLLKQLADRAQAALDAFERLPESGGVEQGIRGTQAFLAWARARR